VTDALAVLLSGLKRKGDSVSVSGKPPFTVRLGSVVARKSATTVRRLMSSVHQ
jgi:hypothetical protein